MHQKHTQQNIQLNNAPLEEQRPGNAHEATHTHAEHDEHRARQMYRCANCDIEFFWLPTSVQGKVYCCTGCAAGGPCNCDYSLYRPVTVMGITHYE